MQLSTYQLVFGQKDKIIISKCILNTIIMLANHLQLRSGLVCVSFLSLKPLNIWIRNDNEVKSAKVQFTVQVLSFTVHEIETGRTNFRTSDWQLSVPRSRLTGKTSNVCEIQKLKDLSDGSLSFQ